MREALFSQRLGLVAGSNAPGPSWNQVARGHSIGDRQLRTTANGRRVNLPEETLKRQLDAAYVALETLGRDRLKWRTNFVALDADLKAKEAALAAAEADLKATEELLRAAEAELKAKEAALKTAETAQQRLAAERESLSERFAGQDEHIRNLQSAVTEKVVERDGFADQLAASEKRVANLRTAYELLAEPLATAAVQLSALETQRNALEAELARLRNSHAGELSALEAQRDTLESELARLRDAHASELSALETQRNTFEAEMARLRESHVGEMSALETQRQGLEEHLARLLSSHSWRVTRPFRVVRRAARPIPGMIRGASRRLTQSVRRMAYGAIRQSGNAALDLLTQGAAWWRMHLGRPRTMWGVTPILTLPLLARCDRLLGLRSDSLVFTTYYTTNNFDINLRRLCDAVYARYPGWAGRMHKIILRLALIRYDAFHLFCDRGVMPPTRRMEINEREMSAIRQHGRRLYTYTYGADVRTRDATLALGRYNICAECPEPMKFCVCDDSEGAGNMARIRASATAMMAMGDMVAYVPGARDFHYWPVDTRALRSVGTDWSGDRPLRVGHAPNHAHFKGTHYLIAAVERLQSEGRAIELVSVQGVPNSEVLALFASCDVVADQFIAGFHGYTALEAMGLGKPVLCYLRGPAMTIDPATCPIINAWPGTVYDRLKDCLDRRYDFPALGRRSRTYVEHYYSLEAVALRLGRLYLATARFGGRIDRKILRRMDMLEPLVPPLISGPPPVPWTSVTEIENRASARSRSGQVGASIRL